jgi:hypothetical protein
MCQSGFYFGFVDDPSLHDLFLYEFSCTIGLNIIQAIRLGPKGKVEWVLFSRRTSVVLLAFKFRW